MTKKEKDLQFLIHVENGLRNFIISKSQAKERAKSIDILVLIEAACMGSSFAIEILKNRKRKKDLSEFVKYSEHEDDRIKVMALQCLDWNNCANTDNFHGVQNATIEKLNTLTNNQKGINTLLFLAQYDDNELIFKAMNALKDVLYKRGVRKTLLKVVIEKQSTLTENKNGIDTLLSLVQCNDYELSVQAVLALKDVCHLKKVQKVLLKVVEENDLNSKCEAALEGLSKHIDQKTLLRDKIETSTWAYELTEKVLNYIEKNCQIQDFLNDIINFSKDDDDLRISYPAIQLLGKIKDEKATKALLRAMDNNENHRTRNLVVETIEQNISNISCKNKVIQKMEDLLEACFGPSRITIPSEKVINIILTLKPNLIYKYAEHQNPDSRWDVLDYLRKHKHKDKKKILNTLMSDEDKEIREQAEKSWRAYCRNTD